MVGSGWIRFRRRDQRALEILGAVTRAAAGNEPLAKFFEIAVHSLLLVGRADRAGIWLKSSHPTEAYLGAAIEAGSGVAPQEWKILDVSLPFFRHLLENQGPVVAQLNQTSAVSLIGPLAGMSEAVSVALRASQSVLGLAMVAYAKPRRGVHPVLLQTLADLLALAVVRRQEQELSSSRKAELASRDQLQRAILLGQPANQILREIATQAVERAQAEFVALGQNGRGPLPFEVFAGQQEWNALIHQEPIADVWRTAMEEGRLVGVGQEALESCRPYNPVFGAGHVSRILAIPLEVRGIRLGVLLAGLAAETEPAAGQERLAGYATLAAATLWEEHRRTHKTETEISWRSLLELSVEPTLLLDHQGVIWGASPSALERLHLDPARLGQAKLEESFANAERSAIAAWCSNALEAWGREIAVPIEGVLSDGSAVRLSVRRALSGLEQHKHWEVFIEDVTLLRAAEQKARRAEAELLSLLESVESGVLLFDAVGRLRLVNDRFVQLMGLEVRRVRELGAFEPLVETIADRIRDPLAFAARWRETRGEQASWDELELVRPTRKVVERYARSVFDAEGARLGWLEVYRDITGQRLLQSKLLRTEKMAALGQLVSGIAHELNNPLTSIMGYAQLLLGRQMEPERAADALKIYQEAERAGRIVKNLLVFTRETKPERRPVDLNEIVERTLALRSYELKVENIAVDVQLDPNLPRALADPAQMQQVVLNLVVNAEQAIQQGSGRGQIRVRTLRRSAGRVAMEVADDGPGIPREIVSRIFDPFFTTKPVGLGTGLGLSIVYGIVQEHGGEILVESEPGRGATFLVELPIVSAEAEDVRAEEAPAGEPSLAGATGLESGAKALGRRARVLVVEDEPTVAQLIADVLRDEGYRVDTVLDSREGLDRLNHRDYELVICDLRMPLLDGRAFYRALVRAGNPLQHRMIFVTGDTLAPHTLEFLDSTGLPYLAKPFLVEELKLAVQRAFRTAPSDVRVAAGGGPFAWPQDEVRKR